jgi:hypothetical protein
LISIYFIYFIHFFKVVCWKGKIKEIRPDTITVSFPVSFSSSLDKERLTINCTKKIREEYGIKNVDEQHTLNIELFPHDGTQRRFVLLGPNLQQDPVPKIPDYSITQFYFFDKFSNKNTRHEADEYFKEIFIGKQVILIGKAEIKNNCRVLTITDRRGFRLYLFIII